MKRFFCLTTIKIKYHHYPFVFKLQLTGFSKFQFIKENCFQTFTFLVKWCLFDMKLNVLMVNQVLLKQIFAFDKKVHEDYHNPIKYQNP